MGIPWKGVIVNKILVQIISLQIDEDRKMILEPKTILRTRVRQLQNQSIISEYLIKWNNLPLEEMTWEVEFFMQKQIELIKF